MNNYEKVARYIMTQIHFQDLRNYVDTTAGRQSGTEVLKLGNEGTFAVNEGDKRYAFTRSQQNKASNMETRQAVYDALRNSGINLDNMSPAMRKAMNYDGSKFVNNRPLSDMRLRKIMAQAEKELAFKDMGTFTNIFTGAEDIMQDPLVGLEFKAAINDMKSVLQDFCNDKISPKKCVDQLKTLRATAQKMIDVDKDASFDLQDLLNNIFKFVNNNLQLDVKDPHIDVLNEMFATRFMHSEESKNSKATRKNMENMQSAFLTTLRDSKPENVSAELRKTMEQWLRNYDKMSSSLKTELKQCAQDIDEFFPGANLENMVDTRN